MTDRPSPEEMLLRAAEEAARERRGRLKVFFGMAPGVGKTYAMLEAGIRAADEGVDVVIGWVETHGRADTEALARRLERLPPRMTTHRGVPLAEFDLDAALARRPALLLLDELAHSNAPGSRHPKRWQDVEELIESRIDVYTSLNVQHLESQNDVVARITSVQVRETVPDALFDRADEIALVDLAPDDLLKRLAEGKVYRGDAASRAADGFFQKGNLIGLRELALRRSTERVDAQVSAWRREHGIADPWNAGERLMVAVGPAPGSRDLVRVAYRIATRLRAPWIAVSVETPATDATSPAVRAQIADNLALAEQLGAECVTARGESVADELVRLARARSVSRIVIGRPTHARWRDRLRGSLVEALIRDADGIDVLVTSATAERGAAYAPVPRAAPAWAWVEALGWVGAAGGLGLAMRPTLSLPDFAMLHLLAVVVTAARVGGSPAVLAAIVNVAAFDFLFVPPFYTFRIADLRYLLTFGVMLGVGLIVAQLTQRVRDNAASASQRERRTAALYSLSRGFATEVDPVAIARIAVAHVKEHLQRDAIVWVAGDGGLRTLAGAGLAEQDVDREVAVARWVLAHGHPAGRGTDTLAAGAALHLPLVGSRGTIGVLALLTGDEALAGDPRTLADAVARQAALALERALLAADAERTRVLVETEQLRNELLSAVSHDLRTPLASITGSATAMLESPNLDDGARRELLDTIRVEGEHLGRLVADLLDLTRIESGTVRARREWVPVEEVIDAAIGRVEGRLGRGRVEIDVPDDVLLAPMDPTLIGQVLVNMLDNAGKYAPAGSPIVVRARADADRLRVEVLDRGPGVPAGEEARVFEKFYRSGDRDRVHGTGLGLAICRAVVHAHGGTIAVTPREGGGARFVFELPLDGPAPEEER